MPIREIDYDPFAEQFVREKELAKRRNILEIDYDPFAGMEEEPAAAPSKREALKPPASKVGTFGGVASALGQGIAEGVTTAIPEMVGESIEFVGSYLPGQAVESIGRDLKEWSEAKGKSLYGEPKKREGLERWVYEGSKMLAPSVVPAGLVGTGVRILTGVGKLVKAGKAAEAVGDIAKAKEFYDAATKAAKLSNNVASASTAGLFGTAQAQSTRDNAELQAKKLEGEGDFEGAKKAREAGQGWAPITAGAIEAGGEFFGTKYLGKLFRLDEAGVAKRGAKQLVGDFLKTLGVEVGTEIGQQGGEAAVEKVSGIRPDADPLAEALDVVGPTAFMTLLTGGMAGAVNRMRRPDDAVDLMEDEKAKEQPDISETIKKEIEKARKAEVKAKPRPSTAKEAAEVLVGKEAVENEQAIESLRRRGLFVPEDQPPVKSAEESAMAFEEEQARRQGEAVRAHAPPSRVTVPIGPELGKRIPSVGEMTGGALPAAAPAARAEEELPLFQPETEIEKIDQKANEAATSPLNDRQEPTEAQKDAGNYAKGHVKLHGLDISIENPRGSERSGTDKAGKPWSVVMEHPYGYIRGTQGRDKDHLDVFIGPDPESTKAFVVDQVNPETGAWDEHKILMGFNTEEEARKGYLDNYQEGWKGLGAITEMPMDEFKTWAKSGPKTKPLAYKEAKAAPETGVVLGGSREEKGAGERAGLTKPGEATERDKAISEYVEKAKEHSPNTAQGMADRIVAMIDAKDNVGLRDWMNGINPNINRLFTKLTGLPAKTQKEADASLRSMNPEKWDEAQEKKKERKATEQEAREQKELDRTLDEQVNYNGKEIVSRRALYDRLIADGYREIRGKKRGAVSEAWFVNPDTSTSMKIPRGHVEYVRGKIAEKAETKPAEGEKKEPWQMTKAEFTAGLKKDTYGGSKKALENAHAKRVAEAISEGKPVPANVLAEYPELVKKEEKAAEKPTFREFIDAKGLAWPVKASDPRYADLKAEYDVLMGIPPAIIETLIEDYKEGERIGQYDDSDLEYPPTEKEIETAAENVVSEEVANGNEAALQAYQAERGEARREENEAPAATAAPAEEVNQAEIDKLEKSMAKWREGGLDKTLPDDYARYMDVLNALKSGEKPVRRDVTEETIREAGALLQKAVKVGKGGKTLGQIESEKKEAKAEKVSRVNKDVRAWIRFKENEPDPGNSQTIHSIANHTIRPMLKKMERDGWVEYRQLGKKGDTWTRSIDKAGLVDKAWDEEGNTYYGLKGTPLREGLMDEAEANRREEAEKPKEEPKAETTQREAFDVLASIIPGGRALKFDLENLNLIADKYAELGIVEKTPDDRYIVSKENTVVRQTAIDEVKRQINESKKANTTPVDWDKVKEAVPAKPAEEKVPVAEAVAPEAVTAGEAITPAEEEAIEDRGIFPELLEVTPAKTIAGEDTGKTTPKQQKAFLIDAIDTLIKDAPAGEFVNVKSSKYGSEGVADQYKRQSELREKYGIVRIEVPDDGTFNIINTKEALEAFKKAAQKFPLTTGVKEDKVAPLPSVTARGKRIAEEGVQYYNEFSPRKQGLVLRPVEVNSQGAEANPNHYVDGYFTEGHYLVKTDKPKEKMSDRKPEVKRIIEGADKNLQPARIVGEYFLGGDPDRQSVMAHIIGKDGKEQIADTKFIDSVLTLYPDAEILIKKRSNSKGDDMTTIVFKAKDKVVAIVMPLRLDDTTTPRKLFSDRIAEILGETPKQEAAKKPEPKPKKEKGPTRGDVAKEFYQPGNILWNGYFKFYDKVLEIKGEIGKEGWSVKVQKVDKDGKALEEPRWHSTLPDKTDRIERKAEKESVDKVKESGVKYDLLKNHPEYKGKPDELKIAEKAINEVRELEGSGTVPAAPGEVAGAREAGGITTHGIGISAHLVEKGRIDLRGRRARNFHEVAVLAEVYRNPQFETLRYIYVKDGVVVAHEGVTSRLPGTASIFVKNPAKEIHEINRRMERLGADGVYLVHNHPSGDPTPSIHDVSLTRRMGVSLRGKVKGHVVINHKKYVYIPPGNDPAVENQYGQGEDPLAAPAVAHSFLGQSIDSPGSAAAWARALYSQDDRSVILYRSAKGKIRAIQEVPVGLVKNKKALTEYVKGRKREFGSVGAIVVSKSEGIDHMSLMDLVNGGVIEDSISIAGQEYKSAREDGPYAPVQEDIKAFKVKEETRPTPQGVEMYEVVEADNFGRQVDEFVAGKILPGNVLDVGRTPHVLRMLGADQLPVVMTYSVTEKVLDRKHGISPEAIKQIPAQLADPVMVFESASQPDSLVVMTELKQDGKTIVVAIRLSRTMAHHEVNDIASIYAKDSDGIFRRWIEDGLLRYQNKQKSREWFQSRGLQLPKEETAIRGLRDRKRDDASRLQSPGVHRSAQGKTNILYRHDLVKWVNENAGEEKGEAKGKRAVIRKEKYSEKRGETGPFHDVWRIYDESGNRVSGVDFSSEEHATGKARALGMTVGDEKLSVRDLHRRGLLKPAKLEDVKKFFPGQEVGKDRNGNIYVKTRGGKYVTLYSVENITPDSAVLKVGYGKTRLAPGAVIPGAMGVKASGELYIKLHRVFGDTWTLAHESTHFMEVAGILNNLDVAALRAHIKRLHREGKFETVNTKDIGGPEDRANFIADRLAIKEQRGPIGRIILRIRAFIDGILDAFGIRSPESILRGIESGQLFERTGREGKGEERYSPATDQTETPAFKKWFGKSKVVDARGKPNTVYHGGRFDADTHGAFDTEYGAHFGTIGAAMERLGGSYVDQAVEEAIVFKEKGRYHLDSDQWPNAPSFRTEEDARTWVAGEAAYEYEEGDETSITSAYLSIKNPKRIQDQGYDERRWAEEIDKAKAEGHDGLVYQNETEDKGQDSWVAFSPEQIKSASSNVGTFDANNPDVRYAPAIIPARLAPMVDSIVQPGVLSRAWDELRYQAQDKFHYLNKAQMEAARQSRSELPESQDAYLAETRYHGMAAAAIEDFDEKHVDPLLELMSENDISVEQADEYLHARHAQEANARLREINPDRDDNQALSGMSDEEARRILEQVESGPKSRAFKEIARRVDAITKARRDLLVEAGLETEETIAKWEETYQHYVPLMREGKSEAMPRKGRGFEVRGGQKLRAGSTREVVNILANVVAQHEATIVRAEKAKVSRAFLEFAKAHRGPWKIDVPEKTASFDEDGLIVYRANPLGYMLADNVLAVRVDGKDHHITFDERDLDGMKILSALKNLDAADMGGVTRAIAKISRWLAVINTSLNPEFIISNFARDIQTAAYNMADNEADAIRMKAIKDAVSFAPQRGIWNFTHNKNRDSEWAQWFNRFRNAGGQTGWMESYETIKDREDALIKKIRAMRPEKAFSVRKGLYAIADFISHGNAAFENGIRLAVFRRLIEAGVPESKAAKIAKELTVNFNRKGNMGPVLNAFYLFYNASIQGSARLIMAGAKSRKVRMFMGATIVFAAALDIMNRANGGDDDDGENRYDKIAPWIKDRNMIIMLPGSGGHLQIPLPWGYNVFHVMGQAAGEVLTKKNNKATDSALRVGGAVVSAFNPMGGEASLLQVVSPTILDPFVQWAENKDWSGRKLRPSSNPYAEKPSSQTYWHSVREPSKWFAQQLNTLTGGDEVRPGKIDISPEAIDLAIDTVTGGAGKFVSNLISTPIKYARGEDVETYEIPFLRRVYGKAGKQVLTSQYYENMDTVRLVQRQLSHYKNDPAKVREIVKENRDEVRLIARMKATQKVMKDLRDQLKAAENIKDPAIRKAREKKIDETMQKVMLGFNKNFNAMKNKEK